MSIREIVEEAVNKGEEIGIHKLALALGEHLLSYDVITKQDLMRIADKLLEKNLPTKDNRP